MRFSRPPLRAWLAVQPPGLSREEAVLEFVRQRSGSEPETMAQFLDRLSASPTRDRAIEIYHERLLIGSPTAAARWVRSLPRSERSDEMIEKTAREWMRTNPEAAETWLLETVLPPERKERLLRQFGR